MSGGSRGGRWDNQTWCESLTLLGAGAPDSYPQHHAKFDVQESEFRKGAEFMGRYIADYLK